jgi:hypothetical protein
MFNIRRINIRRILVGSFSALVLFAIVPVSGLAAAPPGGDIPDNQAFVLYKSGAGGYSLKVPEGWARTNAGAVTTFTSSFNVVSVETAKASKPSTIASAKSSGVAALRRTVKGFTLLKVGSVQRNSGTAIITTYRAKSAPNPVTGKSITTNVERYEFWRNGRVAIVTLAAPAGADNVDAWKLVTNSFRWA